MSAEITRASVEDKLKRYLLNPAHPLGGDKAGFFAQALGFTLKNMKLLSSQIKFDPAKAVQGEKTEFGTKYRQMITIRGANGRHIPIYTVWIKNHDDVIRLVTAIPGD